MQVDQGLREAVIDAVPLHGLLALELQAGEDGRVGVTLPAGGATENQLGFQAAGSLFSVADAAAAVAVFSAFAGELAGLTAVVASAEVRYLRPASGAVVGFATLEEDPDALRARLAADGKVAFGVAVELRASAPEPVAQVHLRWHLRRERGRPAA